MKELRVFLTWGKHLNTQTRPGVSLVGYGKGSAALGMLERRNRRTTQNSWVDKMAQAGTDNRATMKTVKPGAPSVEGKEASPAHSERLEFMSVHKNQHCKTNETSDLH